MNREVDSLIIKLCHSETNFTTVQFDNFKMVLRDEVGEPRLFTSEECLSSEYIENFVQLKEQNFDILKTIVEQAKVHRNQMLDFWRLTYDLEEALKVGKEKNEKIPEGFHAC